MYDGLILTSVDGHIQTYGSALILYFFPLGILSLPAKCISRHFSKSKHLLTMSPS